MRHRSIVAGAVIVCFVCACGHGAADPPGRLARNGANLNCKASQDWPAEYLQTERTKPSFTRTQAKEAGFAMAKLFLDDPKVADDYLKTVQAYKKSGGDFTNQYEKFVKMAYPHAKYDDFNAHDFANVHHAAWLYLMRAFASLVDKNPHHNGTWGDPNCGVSEITDGKEDHEHAFGLWGGGVMGILDYHNIPNGSGKYAINTTDISPPGLSAREAGR